MDVRITFSSSHYKFIFQVIFPNVITYFDRTLKEEQNYMYFKNEIVLLNWCKFHFYLPSQ